MDNRTDEIAFAQLVTEKELKAGSNGCVYLVRSRETRTRYIYRVFTGSADVYRKLLGITCPQLPRIYDVKEENGKVYVLEEYIQGDTLAFLLEEKPLSPAQAKQILLQLCAALEVLHGIGAVHRDIKPDNILLRGSDAVLIDFDASRLCKEAHTTDTRIMGTTGYAAPEQYGFSQTDGRADIFALGILLNEMLTLQHPSRLLAEGEFRPIIQTCTQINADQRYSSAAELIAALDPPPRRFPLRKALPVLLALGIALGGALLYRPTAAQEAPAQTQSVPATTQEAPRRSSAGIPKETLRPLPEVDVFLREQKQIPMEPWEGETEGHATPFQCDMDGDGEMERYLFGVDFIDSPHENVVYYDRNLAYPDDYHIRSVHPCVWRVMDDGTMEAAVEFAQLLTDPYVNIWRVDDFATPEPIAWTMDYAWPGCVSIKFYPVQDGTWLYEVGACLGDSHLTASATTTFYFE